MPGEVPAPMYCAHMGTYGCELSNCEEHECHLDDRRDVEIRMPHTDADRALRIQLATALRELSEAKDRVSQLTSVVHERGQQIALERERFTKERDALRAEVQRLREELEDIAAWNDDQIALIQKEKDRIEDPKGYLHQWEMAHKIAAHDARAALCTGGDRE